MIIPDINLLIYAYNSSLPEHSAAKEWFENSLNGNETVGIAPAVVMGFIRILSNPRIVEYPENPGTLTAIARSWFKQPVVRSIVPGTDYLERLESLFRSTGASGKLTTDLYLAALALGLDGTIYSSDRDFQRIPGLKLCNPLDCNRTL